MSERPFEFVVKGTPVSARARLSSAREKWKACVREASARPQGLAPMSGPVSVTLYYFSAAPMQGSLDDIVKPVLEACRGHVYRDDAQVERIVARKFEPERIVAFGAPSRMLSAAIGEEKPLLYVRIGGEQHEDPR